jgi:Family of unknown function (DUF6056)
VKRAVVVWAAVVVPTWIVFVLCTHWEPILRDGWGHLQWHKHFATTPANLWTFAHDSYVHNNPRLGQVLTLLVYTPGPYHELVTPIVELTLFWLLATLALGRRPSLARTDDALVFATILATVTLSAPQIGPMLFYRPFTGNYLFGLVIGAAFLVPFRVHGETPRRRGWWWIPIMLVLGAAAGLSNEHTGPTFAVVVACAVVLFVRRGERPAAWMIAAMVGIAAGGLALYFAPGQGIRYNGIGGTSMLGRIGGRSLSDNARIVFVLFAYLWRISPWLLLGLVAWRTTATRDPVSRPRAIAALVAIGAAVLIACTLLVSPKQGPRLYFAPVALACTALASLVVPVVRQRATRAIAWVLVAAALGYVGFNLVRTYHTVGPEFAHRFEAIETAPKHAVVYVTPYSLGRSRWFLGEDFGVDKLRFNLAFSRGLQGIVLVQPAAAANEGL